jgi:hypothetical protein
MILTAMARQQCSVVEGKPYRYASSVLFCNRIGGVIISVLALYVVDHGFEPWLGQIKDYEIGICCFSTKHAALRSKSKDWLARNQNNVFEWNGMSIRGLLFQ